MRKYQKVLILLVALSIIAGGLALWASAYSLEISDKTDEAYDRVYESIINYGK